MVDISNQKKLVIFAVIIGGFLLIGGFFCVLCIIYFSFFSVTPSPPSATEVETQRFKYQEYNLQTKNLELSVVKYDSDLLKGKEFISYPKKKNGATVFISPLGGDEYECTGSCYCETEEERRISTALTRSMFLVVSALSTPVAIQMAKSAFDNQCKEQFSDVCKMSDTKSTIEECMRKREEIIKRMKSEKDSTEDDEILSTWECEGHCLPNEEVEERVDLWDQLNSPLKDVKCEGMKYSRIFRLEDPPIDGRVGYVVQANVEFVRPHLDTYCKEQSKVNTGKGGTVSLCKGDSGAYEPYEFHDNAECYVTFITEDYRKELGLDW